ncbi:MAG TPA: hypothetical protein VM123_11940 [archaeon]|nr:hypothetical protein [archaeon]
MLKPLSFIPVSLLCGNFLLSAPVDGRSAKIQNDFWQVELDSENGAVKSLAARNGKDSVWTDILAAQEGKDLGLGRRAGIEVFDIAREKAFRAGSPGMELVSVEGGGARALVSHRLKLDDRFVSLVVEYRLDGSELSWKATITGNGEGNRSLRVAFELPLGESWLLWVQSRAGMVRPAAEDGPLSFWYLRAPEGVGKFDDQYPRHDLTLPLVTLLDRQRDLGLTVSHPVDDRKPSAGFLTRRLEDGSTVLESVTALVGLRSRISLQVTGYLVAHRACYRPGLKWMFDKWPEYFLPDPGIYEKKGIFSIGNPGTGARNLDGSYNYEGELEYGAAFFEMHAHFPWYGLYFPENPQTDTWPDLLKIEHGRPREDSLSVRLICGRLRNLAKAGFHTFYYYAINDGYPPEAHKRWKDAVACWPGGREALSGWRGGGIEYRSMNADPSFSFGRELMRQADGVIEQVGPLGGIFFDTIHHNDLDFAHDDGITLVCLDGQSVPAYSINFCYDFFLDYISKRLHERREYLFINGPSAIRNVRGVDAIMLEGQGAPEWEYEFENRRFLSCISRPMYWLFPGRPAQRMEIFLQRCLVYGAFPSAPPSARAGFRDSLRIEKDKALWQPYLPLYEALRGRVLCFEPDPLSVPLGCRGEVFTMPGGSYAVALIHEGMSVLDPANSANPAITLRLEKKISRVRVLTPLDHEGKIIEPEYDESGDLQLDLPDFKGAAVLFLDPVL